MVISPAKAMTMQTMLLTVQGPQVIHCGINETTAEEDRLRPVHQPL